MASMRILSARGDTAVEWDAAKFTEGDPEARAAVAEAERLFQELKAKGATAFTVRPGRPAERLDVFDPLAEQIVIVPRVAGG